jgi:hypothetical protein
VIPRWLLSLLGLSRWREQTRARAAIRGEIALRHRPEEEHVLAVRRTMTERAREPHVVLGQLDDSTPYVLPLSEFDGLFGWVSGATGSGKTRLALAWIDQILHEMARGAAVSVIVIDLKGELTELVLSLLAERVIQRREVGRLLTNLLTVRFFAEGAALPPWNLLAPMPGMSVATHARAIAEALEHALGMSLGSRQENVFGMVLAYAIERGLTIAELRAALEAPEELAADGARSKSPEVRTYFEHRFARETPATRDGLTSRLDLLLSLDSIRAMVSARDTIDWRTRLAPGCLSILDLGGAPFGGDSPRRAIASLALQFVLSGIFDPGRTRDGFTLLVCDEIQEAVTPATLRNLDRIVTTARSFRAGLLSIHQSLTQLPPAFLQLLSTNVRLRAIGRSGADDAWLSREWLPITGTVVRSQGARPGERTEFISRTDEERLRVEELGRAPRQRFLLADRVAPWGTRSVTAPSITPPVWKELPAELRARLERGAYGRPREELLAESTPPVEIDAEPAEPTAPRATSTRSRRRSSSRKNSAEPMPDLIVAAERFGRGRRVR